MRTVSYTVTNKDGETFTTPSYNEALKGATYTTHYNEITHRAPKRTHKKSVEWLKRHGIEVNGNDQMV